MSAFHPDHSDLEGLVILYLAGLKFLYTLEEKVLFLTTETTVLIHLHFNHQRNRYRRWDYSCLHTSGSTLKLFGKYQVELCPTESMLFFIQDEILLDTPYIFGKQICYIHRFLRTGP